MLVQFSGAWWEPYSSSGAAARTHSDERLQVAGHVSFWLLMRRWRPMHVVLSLGQPRAVYCQLALLQPLLCCAAGTNTAACICCLVLLGIGSSV